MSAAYSRNEIIEKCEEAVKDVSTFYSKPFVNYRSKTTDTKEYYTEVVSEFICENIKLFQNNIRNITRKASYKTESHTGTYKETSNRIEEITAIKMFNQSKKGIEFDNIGKIIDYQIPLKSFKSDIAGKIDLLSFNGENLRILELKKSVSKETMLRCVIEGYTYLKTVNIEKLLKDFGLPKNTIVKASAFVFKNESQYKEMHEDRPSLKRLMKLLDIEPFYITELNGVFSVEK